MRSVKGKDTDSSIKEIEMKNDVVYTNNPLLNMSDSKDVMSNKDADSRVYELERENADQKTEISDLKTKVTILEGVIEELKSKYENNTGNKSADL